MIRKIIRKRLRITKYFMYTLAASCSIILANLITKMKFLCFILTILTICIVDNELGDIKTRNKPLLNILIKCDEGLSKLECEENYPVMDIYPYTNEKSAKYDIYNSYNLYSVWDITSLHNARTKTRNFNEDMIFMYR